MSAWRTLLAGLTVWLAHFAIVYALPSLEAVGAVRRGQLTVIHGFATGTCLAAAGVLALAGWRRVRASTAAGEAFRHRVATLGAALAWVAIAWQAAPALMG